MNLLVHRDYRHPISVLPTTSSAPVDTWVDQIRYSTRVPRRLSPAFCCVIWAIQTGIDFQRGHVTFHEPGVQSSPTTIWFSNYFIIGVIVDFVNKVEIELDLWLIETSAQKMHFLSRVLQYLTFGTSSGGHPAKVSAAAAVRATPGGGGVVCGYGLATR